MRLFLRLSILLIPILFGGQLFAQQTKPVPVTKIPVTPSQDTIQEAPTPGLGEMDISDVIALLFKRPPSTTIDSITSKPTISIVPAIGYTLVSRLAIVLSGNMAFRTGPKSRISNIVASISYTQNKQIILPIQTNIWTTDNKYNFIGSYRYYKYPQNTYGLGSNSDINDVNPMDYSFFEFYQTVLRHISGNLYLGGGYIFDNHWNITDKGNSNGTVSDYEIYGKDTHTIASGITINGLLDSRDNAINPTKGGYAYVQYRDNYAFLGSTTPWRSLIVDVRKYYRFPEGSKNVIALWSYDWLILSGKPGYLDLPSNHWDFNSATGRGYIQSRFRGAQMVYLEGEYRFRITNNGLLGGVAFLNLESFSAAPGTQLQSLQPGYGPGLRIKLNKLSNTNITIDYGFGNQGSNGLFISVGEAF